MKCFVTLKWCSQNNFMSFVLKANHAKKKMQKWKELCSLFIMFSLFKPMNDELTWGTRLLQRRMTNSSLKHSQATVDNIRNSFALAKWSSLKLIAILKYRCLIRARDRLLILINQRILTGFYTPCDSSTIKNCAPFVELQQSQYWEKSVTEEVEDFF